MQRNANTPAGVNRRGICLFKIIRMLGGTSGTNLPRFAGQVNTKARRRLEARFVPYRKN